MKTNSQRWFLAGSIFCFCYFVFLLLINYHSLNNEIMVGSVSFFGELLTIPLILFLLFMFIFSLIKVIKKDNSFRLIFIINLITIVLLISSTFYN